MESSRITAAQLEKATLKAEYYGTDFRRAASLIKNFGKSVVLDDIRRCDIPIRRGIDMPRFSTDASSPLLVTIASFTDPGLEFSRLDRLDRKQHMSFRGSSIGTGDLLIAMGGYVGAAAIVPQNCPEANIGRHTAKVVVDDTKADKYFVWSYIRSRTGTLLFSREVTGSVQAGINLEDLRQISIPYPNRLTQSYIGNKVRHAEKLRLTVNKTIRECFALHIGLIPDEGRVSTARQTRRVTCAEMTERLDAHFYPAAVVKYFSEVATNCRPLSEVTHLVEAGATRNETDSTKFSLQATVANLSSRFPDKRYRHVQFAATPKVSLQSHDLLICNAAHNKEYIGREITYCDDWVRGVLPSTEVMAIRVDRMQLPASYVRAFLLTEIGHLQIQSTIRGISAHTYPSDMRRVLIPLPKVPEARRREFDATDEGMLFAGRCERQSEALVVASKLLVEAILDKRIGEDELTAAQDQLMHGNQSGDREILSRLYEGGIDAVATRPLFPDLYAYYETLQMAERVLADGGGE